MRKLEVCGTLAHLRPGWLGLFFLIFHPKMMLTLVLMQLSVRARVKWLTFCFKVLLEVGVGHTGCYLKGIVKCIVDDSFKQNLDKKRIFNFPGC